VSALWTSGEVAQALGAVIAVPFEATGVTFDSRAVAAGDLFFALKGETTDGHGFVAEAMKRGAAAAVVSREVENAGGTLIRVPDTLKALEGLGRAARRRSKARIASVTGSVGKTSTKDALRAMLSAQAPNSASTASFNNHVGVPISLARLPREARYGVFEIGMNHPGEI
jgi:UDP-N-acetylmuramoyl-tripeptide--D-alanyl-D-alanine ligase